MPNKGSEIKRQSHSNGSYNSYRKNNKNNSVNNVVNDEFERNITTTIETTVKNTTQSDIQSVTNQESTDSFSVDVNQPNKETFSTVTFNDDIPRIEAYSSSLNNRPSSNQNGEYIDENLSEDDQGSLIDTADDVYNRIHDFKNGQSEIPSELDSSLDDGSGLELPDDNESLNFPDESYNDELSSEDFVDNHSLAEDDLNSGKEANPEENPELDSSNASNEPLEETPESGSLVNPEDAEQAQKLDELDNTLDAVQPTEPSVPGNELPDQSFNRNRLSNNPQDTPSTELNNYRKNNQFKNRMGSENPPAGNIGDSSASTASNAAKTGAADAAKETTKEAVKETAKDAAKEASKEVAKEGVKEGAKEGAAAAAEAGGEAAAAGASSGPWGVLIVVIVIVAVIVSIITIAILSVLITYMVVDYELKLNQDSSQSYLDSKYQCSSDYRSPMSLTKTTLSKSEFIEKVKAYNSSNSKYQIFKDNAGLIYDLGIQSGINPELAVTRAIQEGFSPGSNYNYWGIGCYNESSTCKGSYKSFEDGVLAFYATIKKYNTDSMYVMYDNYVDLGKYWYATQCHLNGSAPCSDKGGCYYLPYIQEFLEPSQASKYQYICQHSTCMENASGTCVQTDDVAQDAYIQWQIKNTMEVRKSVFKIDNDNVKTCNGYDVNLAIKPTDVNQIPILENNKTVSKILEENGSSVKKFNDQLYNNTLKDGIGTRQAVVDAALLFINTFETVGYRLPYSYGGGWSGFNYDYNLGVESYYGLNPYIGTVLNNGKGYTQKFSTGPTTYYYLGLDCSGFVTWALRNGGINIGITEASAYQNKGTTHPANSTDFIAKPGDVLSSSSHVVLVVSYNQEKKAYIVAEAASKNDGILVSTRYLSKLNNYKVVDLSGLYKSSVNQNYKEAFNAGRKG